jgi:nicotinamidase-related amidase
MLGRRTLLLRAATAALTLMIAFAASSWATDILDEWDAVKPPPRPELKPVALQSSTTALLVMDMTKTGACGMRPRCAATVPNIKRLLDAAHAAGAMVWYSLPSATNVIDPAIAPRDGEWQVQNGPDKFLGSNLDEKLKARGIKTVVVCGTSFQGVGIGTGSASAERGYMVIVPIDCLSSEDTYMEQYAAWHMYKGGPAVVTQKMTLTRSTMVKFAN